MLRKYWIYLGLFLHISLSVSHPVILLLTAKEAFNAADPGDTLYFLQLVDTIYLPHPLRSPILAIMPFFDPQAASRERPLVNWKRK